MLPRRETGGPPSRRRHFLVHVPRMTAISRLSYIKATSVSIMILLLVLMPSVSPEKIPIGAIFEQGTDEVQSAFKFAMFNHNQNTTGRRFELQAFVDVINTADAFKLSRLICSQFSRGVFSMLGAVSPDSFDTLHSYSNTFQMPFVTPWFPEKVLTPSSGFLDFAISMRPDYHRAIIDTVRYYGWKKIIYLYDSHDGNLMMLGCGFHEGWSTSMIPKLDGNDPTITITPDQGSWIINFMYVGVGLTSLIAPISMEKIGRKWSLLSGTLPLTAGWLLLAFGQHYVTLYIGRFLAGLGCGIAYSITPTYIGEISSKMTRGPLGTMTAVLINTGMLIVSVIGLHVSRFTLGIISVWLPIIFALTFVWMPESPLFLARTNRLTEAEQALKWSLGKDNVLEELQQIERTISKDKTHTIGILISFKRISERVNLKAFGIIIILLCALSFTGATPILAYQSYIYEEAGFDFSTNVNILVTGCAVVIAGICCVCVVKVTGKKTLLLIAMPLCALSLGTIAIFFTVLAYKIDMPNFRWIPTVFVVIFVVAYGLAINPIPLAYAGEIFAPDVKLPAAMFCSIFYSVATTVVTKLYQVLRETYGTHVPMWTLASLTIVIWIFIYLYVPETEGKTLEDIQKEMAGEDKKPTGASVINI